MHIFKVHAFSKQKLKLVSGSGGSGFRSSLCMEHVSSLLLFAGNINTH